MALVDVLLSDPHRSLRGQVSPLFARAIVAALSANPTTLVELDLALSRFAKRIGDRSLLEDFDPVILNCPTHATTGQPGPTPGDSARSQAAVPTGVAVLSAPAGTAVAGALASEAVTSWHQGPSLAAERVSIAATHLPAAMVPQSGLLIDLPARVVVAQGLGFRVEAADRVTYVEDNPDREVVTRYSLGPSWTLLPDGFAADSVRHPNGVATEWLRLVAQQRKIRASLLRVDDQAVLYDRLLDFLAEALLSDRFQDSDDPIRDIHAEWLLTPRADLFGACPRDLLIGRRTEVDDEISVREWEWTVLKECPAPLPADSEAVRESGHGTKEYAIYYEMIRHLLAEGWSRIDERGQLTPSSLAERLRQWRDEWLDCPGYDDVPNCTPRWVIEQERRRIPWLVEAHDQFHDPDCPICRWSREQTGPSFHQIMVCHEEEGFAFSFLDSEEVWKVLARSYDDGEREDGDGLDDVDDDDELKEGISAKDNSEKDNSAINTSAKGDSAKDTSAKVDSKNKDGDNEECVDEDSGNEGDVDEDGGSAGDPRDTPPARRALRANAGPARVAPCPVTTQWEVGLRTGGGLQGSKPLDPLTTTGPVTQSLTQVVTQILTHAATRAASNTASKTAGPTAGSTAAPTAGPTAVPTAARGPSPTATVVPTPTAQRDESRPVAAPPTFLNTPRPMVPNLELLEPAQQVTVWHLRLVLLLIDIRDRAGQGEDRQLAARTLRSLHEFRDAVREHEGWMAEQYLQEVSVQVAAIGARRADLASMCQEFELELKQMRKASQAALNR